MGRKHSFRKSSTIILFPTIASQRIAVFAFLNFLALMLTVALLESLTLFPLPIFIVACFSLVANLCCYGTSGNAWNFFLENLKGDGILNIVRILPLIAMLFSMICALITALALFSVPFPPIFLAIPIFIVSAYTALGLFIVLARAIHEYKEVSSSQSSNMAADATPYSYQGVPSEAIAATPSIVHPGSSATSTAEQIATSGGSPLMSPLAGSPDMQLKVALEATPLKSSTGHLSYHATSAI